jgi:pyruvate kinase
MVQDQIQILKERGFLHEGNVVVNTGSIPIQLHLPTNMLKITRVD